MTKSLMISALRLGKTGDEILNILDQITDDSDSELTESVESVMQTVEVLNETISQGVSVNEPTLEPIEF